jgi:hypothetical protein
MVWIRLELQYIVTATSVAVFFQRTLPLLLAAACTLKLLRGPLQQCVIKTIKTRLGWADRTVMHQVKMGVCRQKFINLLAIFTRKNRAGGI